MNNPFVLHLTEQQILKLNEQNEDNTILSQLETETNKDNIEVLKAITDFTKAHASISITDPCFEKSVKLKTCLGEIELDPRNGYCVMDQDNKTTWKYPYEIDPTTDSLIFDRQKGTLKNKDTSQRLSLHESYIWGMYITNGTIKNKPTEKNSQYISFKMHNPYLYRFLFLCLQQIKGCKIIKYEREHEIRLFIGRIPSKEEVVKKMTGEPVDNIVAFIGGLFDANFLNIKDSGAIYSTKWAHQDAPSPQRLQYLYTILGIVTQIKDNKTLHLADTAEDKLRLWKVIYTSCKLLADFSQIFDKVTRTNISEEEIKAIQNQENISNETKMEEIRRKKIEKEYSNTISGGCLKLADHGGLPFRNIGVLTAI